MSRRNSLQNPAGVRRMSSALHEAQCLQSVHQLIKENSTIKSLNGHALDQYLSMSARSNQNNAYHVFKNFQHFYTYATETFPDLFCKVNAQKLACILEKKLYRVTKPKSEDCPGILFFSVKHWKPSEIPVDDMIAAGMLYLYQMSKQSMEVQKNGIAMVVDIDGFGFSHARHITYDAVKKLMSLLIYASPVKVIAHVSINSLTLFEKVYQVIKYVIPEKARKDIYMLKKDLTPFHKLFPSIEDVPECCGGSSPDNSVFVKDIETLILSDLSLQNLIHDMQVGSKIKRKMSR